MMRSGPRELADGIIIGALAVTSVVVPESSAATFGATALSARTVLVLAAAGFAGARFGLLGGGMIGLMLAVAGTLRMVVTRTADGATLVSAGDWSALALHGACVAGLAAILGWFADRLKGERERLGDQTKAYQKLLYLRDRQSNAETEARRSQAALKDREINRYSCLVVSLHEAAQRINRHLNVHELCRSFLRSLEEVLGVEAATVYLLDESGTRLAPAAHVGGMRSAECGMRNADSGSPKPEARSPEPDARLSTPQPDRDATTGIYEWCLTRRPSPRSRTFL